MARQLRRAHGRRAFLVDQLDDAHAQEGVLLHHLGEVVAHLQPLEGVSGRGAHGLRRRMARPDVIEKIGQLVEELRKVVEQHRLVEVPCRLEHPDCLDPFGKEPFLVGAHEIGQPARFFVHSPLFHT